MNRNFLRGHRQLVCGCTIFKTWNKKKNKTKTYVLLVIDLFSWHGGSGDNWRCFSTRGLCLFVHLLPLWLVSLYVVATESHDIWQMVGSKGRSLSDVRWNVNLLEVRPLVYFKLLLRLWWWLSAVNDWELPQIFRVEPKTINGSNTSFSPVLTSGHYRPLI